MDTDLITMYTPDGLGAIPGLPEPAQPLVVSLIATARRVWETMSQFTPAIPFDLPILVAMSLEPAAPAAFVAQLGYPKTPVNRLRSQVFDMMIDHQAVLAASLQTDRAHHRAFITVRALTPDRQSVQTFTMAMSLEALTSATWDNQFILECTGNETPAATTAAPLPEATHGDADDDPIAALTNKRPQMALIALEDLAKTIQTDYSLVHVDPDLLFAADPEPEDNQDDQPESASPDSHE